MEKTPIAITNARCCDESSPGEETAPEQRETLGLQLQSQAQAQARVPMSWPTPDSLSRASHARPYPSITNLVCLSSGRAAGRSLKIGYWQPAGAKKFNVESLLQA
ncbi:hypothetical protein FOXG_08283 [Fusarium oxysporum f. sp. lycopersici 4287]|uniref:Uncharacterized protein n=2 Tax=Fusarium oxysporum TaxID=5507 RepID=A0A0J9WN95_FUSO4|nr:hypothetical protein FOXG_08283 [Fusarium oxysporum f. sp. lycopersici 4287]KNB06892.1 hypothetical protein FOXG_08283 [Fusarium oxysporum f. sp. lycopersici 4287]